MNSLIFDIETIPDTEYGQRVLHLTGTPMEVAKAMVQLHHEKTGSEFLPLEQHQVIAISAAFRLKDGLKVWSLGELTSTEGELLERFFEGIARYTPNLVSWNGAGFDLPALHYRALKHGISAPRYWASGEDDKEFRYNNYRNRYHERHLDLMDVLSGYQGRAKSSLDKVAQLIGLPGKFNMHGDEVLQEYFRGNLSRIRDYCETDVINTYLVYLRFELFRGRLSQTEYPQEVERMRRYLATENKPHFREYLEAWTGGN